MKRGAGGVNVRSATSRARAPTFSHQPPLPALDVPRPPAAQFRRPSPGRLYVANNSGTCSPTRPAGSRGSMVGPCVAASPCERHGVPRLSQLAAVQRVRPGLDGEVVASRPGSGRALASAHRPDGVLAVVAGSSTSATGAAGYARRPHRRLAVSNRRQGEGRLALAGQAVLRLYDRPVRPRRFTGRGLARLGAGPVSGRGNFYSPAVAYGRVIGSTDGSLLVRRGERQARWSQSTSRLASPAVWGRSSRARAAALLALDAATGEVWSFGRTGSPS